MNEVTNDTSVMYCLHKYIKYIEEQDEENTKLKEIICLCIYSYYIDTKRIKYDNYLYLLENFDINKFILICKQKNIDNNFRVFLGLKILKYI